MMEIKDLASYSAEASSPSDGMLDYDRWVLE